jgi:hypothetical protein
MNLAELVEQLELIQQDHPHSAHLEVRINRETAEVFAHLGFSFSSPWS